MIEAAHITVRRGETLLLREVSLCARPGTLTAVLGPNGAGKSTLARALSGELAVHSGEVRIRGRALPRWDPRALARVRAVLPQRTQLAFDFDALEVVALGRLPHGDSDASAGRALARKSLALVGLEHAAHRPLSTLSGGEQQRVHLARALAQLEGVEGGGILLLDEPIASLDLAWQLRVLALLRALRDAGTVVVTVLHELTLAAHFADELVLLSQGAVLASGPPALVLRDELLSAAWGAELRVVRAPELGACVVMPVLPTLPIAAP